MSIQQATVSLAWTENKADLSRSVFCYFRMFRFPLSISTSPKERSDQKAEFLDESLKSFLHCFSQSALQLCFQIFISSNSRNLSSYSSFTVNCKGEMRKTCLPDRKPYPLPYGLRILSLRTLKINVKQIVMVKYKILAIFYVGCRNCKLKLQYTLAGFVLQRFPGDMCCKIETAPTPLPLSANKGRTSTYRTSFLLFPLFVKKEEGRPQVKYGVRSPKFISAPFTQLYSLAQTLHPPPPPRIWAHIRGRYWSAKIDDISQ